MSSIIADLAEGLDCRIGHKVSRIDHDGQRFWVTHDDEKSPRWSCDILAIATPPAQAMALIETLKGFSPLPTIHDSPCSSLSLTYRTAKPSLDAGTIGWHNAIYSIVHAKRLPQADPNIDGATIHFRYADIGLDRAVDVACRLLNIEPSDILSTWQKINRLPALRPAHLPQIAQLQKNAYPNLALLGNYFHGFSIEDCVRRSAEEFDRIYQGNRKAADTFGALDKI